MKDLLIECRTALGLAKSMAERERYDTDVYTKRIEMIDKALRIHDTVGRSEQLKCPCCGSEEVQIHQDCSTCDECKNMF